MIQQEIDSIESIVASAEAQVLRLDREYDEALELEGQIDPDVDREEWNLRAERMRKVGAEFRHALETSQFGKKKIALLRSEKELERRVQRTLENRRRHGAES